MLTVILCGGKATRLYPLFKKIPKSMIEINGKPFLEYQIQLLKRNGISEIVLCVGNKANQIRNYFKDGASFDVKIKYSSDGKNLMGTGGALKKAEKLLPDIFSVLYGDSYLPFDFRKALAFFKKNNKLGMMTVLKNNDKYGRSNTKMEGNLVKYYSKKHRIENTDLVDYGLSLFRKEALKYLPENRHCDMSVLHKALIKRAQLLAYPVKKRFYEIGSFKGLKEFKYYIHKQKL